MVGEFRGGEGQDRRQRRVFAERRVTQLGVCLLAERGRDDWGNGFKMFGQYSNLLREKNFMLYCYRTFQNCTERRLVKSVCIYHSF